MTRDQYENPLVSRYASAEMSNIWSPQQKFETWRRLWIALAEAQKDLGLAISDAQLEELRNHATNINWQAAAEYEAKLRHDVMAHVHAYGDQCPAARPILHWGATSCFVTDNTDLILLRKALELTLHRLVAVIDRLATFAEQHGRLACLGFTHLQPAQPTTVGKRACLWAYDLVLDLDELEHRLSRLAARSIQGTTGTQASFLQLFDGDHSKVIALQKTVARKIGFDKVYSITGQTYSRKVDAQILDVLSGIAQSAHKAGSDLRLLASRKEIEEPFESHQIGSSAMAYKRNPMRSERMCGLSRFVTSLQGSAAATAATQWMERSLDDSANRRLVIPQAFLATDAVLLLYENVSRGLVVYPQVILANLNRELPFMATENILMAAVSAGGDRQTLHEVIRTHSQESARVVKQEGGENDLLERLAADSRFAGLAWKEVVDVQKFVGRAPEQVTEFIETHVKPLRVRYASALKLESDVKL